MADEGRVGETRAALAGAGPMRDAIREAGSLWRFARSRPGFLCGLVVVFVTLALALCGPWIAPYPPEEALPGRSILPPSGSHWMGTDISGMDIFSRVISAPRI